MAKQFPNAQLSRPIPGNENLRFLNFRGEALGSRGDVVVFSPPAMESLQRVPLLLLLHGVYGCQWNWWLNAGLDTIATGDAAGRNDRSHDDCHALGWTLGRRQLGMFPMRTPTTKGGSSMMSRAACVNCFRNCIRKNFFSRGSRWAASELCA